MASGFNHTKPSSGRICQGFRAQLPEAGQGPDLRIQTDLSWGSVGFEQPRPAELTLPCIVEGKGAQFIVGKKAPESVSFYAPGFLLMAASSPVPQAAKSRKEHFK